MGAPSEEVLTIPLTAQMKREEPEFAEYIQIVWRRRILLLVVTTAIVVLSLLFPTLTGLKYEASVSLKVGAPEENAQTTADRAADGQLLARLISQLGLRTSVEALARRISVTDVAGVVHLAIRSETPEEGFTIARLLADELIKAHELVIAGSRMALEQSREELLALKAEMRRNLDALDTVLQRMSDRGENAPQPIPLLQETVSRRGSILIATEAELAKVDAEIAGLETRILGISVQPLSPWPQPIQHVLVAGLLGLCAGLPLVFLVDYLQKTPDFVHNASDSSLK